MKPVSGIIITIGKTRGRPPHRLFGMRQADRLFHSYIVGQTGVGKSTLLFNMASQDVHRRQGFCLIDPHGDLARKIADIAGDRCIYWDAADEANPYGYNPLTFVAEQYRPLIASGLIDALKKQWADAWGARMEHLLRHAILALLSRPGSTLADIMPLFLEPGFRKEVVASVKDEQLRRFWTQEFPKMNYKTAADGVSPIANKLGGFLSHPVIRKSVCEPEKPLRFRKLMDEGQILIVNLAKGRLGADIANILGGLIVSTFAMAAYSRQNLREEDRKPYFLYVDEFHSFTTTAFAGMLSELRKHGLGLVLAHQFISQLEDEVSQAIFGNVGTLISFRVGAKDAPVLTRQFASGIPEPPDLINLDNQEMFIKLMIDGKQGRAFSAST